MTRQAPEWHFNLKQSIQKNISASKEKILFGWDVSKRILLLKFMKDTAKCGQWRKNFFSQSRRLQSECSNWLFLLPCECLSIVTIVSWTVESSSSTNQQTLLTNWRRMSHTSVISMKKVVTRWFRKALSDSLELRFARQRRGVVYLYFFQTSNCYCHAMSVGIKTTHKRTEQPVIKYLTPVHEFSIFNPIQIEIMLHLFNSLFIKQFFIFSVSSFFTVTPSLILFNFVLCSQDMLLRDLNLSRIFYGVLRALT